MAAISGGSPMSSIGRFQACKRCHIRKRKCDRAFPRCSACEAASVECHIDWKGSNNVLTAENERLRDSVYALERRVAELQLAVTTGSETDVTISGSQSHDVGSNTVDPAKLLISRITTANEHTAVKGLSNCSTHPQKVDAIPALGALANTVLQLRCSPQDIVSADALSPVSQSAHSIPPSKRDVEWEEIAAMGAEIEVLSLHDATPSGLPSLKDTMAIFTRFTSDLKMTHQIVNLSQLNRDLQLVYTREGGLTNPQYTVNRFRVFMVLCLSGTGYLGYSDEKAETIKSYKERAMAELARVLTDEDLTTVQALSLLTLMTFYESGGSSMWHVVGIAMRAAVAINLHRKEEVFLAPYKAIMSADTLNSFNEHRKNLFWSLYVLDRLSMISLGRPMFLRDQDIEVEAASDDEGGTSISPAAYLRHGVHGRRLQTWIQDSLYGVGVRPAISTEFGEAMIADYMSQLEGWYNSSPLKAAFVPQSEATMKRQCIDDINYQHMVILLHRPSPLLPQVSPNYIKTLYKASSLSIELFNHYITEGKLSLHGLHLSYLLSSCMVLVYCYFEYQIRPELSSLPLKQILDQLQRCKNLITTSISVVAGGGSLSSLESLMSLLKNGDSAPVPNRASPVLAEYTEARTGTCKFPADSSPMTSGGQHASSQPVADEYDWTHTSTAPFLPTAIEDSFDISSLLPPTTESFSPWCWSFDPRELP